MADEDDLNFTISAHDGASDVIDKVLAAFRSLHSQSQVTAGGLDRVDASAQQASGSVASIAPGAQDAAKALAGTGQAASGAAKAVDTLAGVSGNAATALDASAVAGTAASKANQHVAQSAETAAKAQETVAQSADHATRSAEHLAPVLENTGKAASGAAQSAGKLPPVLHESGQGLEEVGKRSHATASLFENLTSAVTSTVGQLLAMVGTLGAVFSATEIVRSAMATAEMGSKLQDLAADTGAAVPWLVTMRQVFKDTGAGADSLGTAIVHMQESIVDAARNGGQKGALFRDMMLDVEKLSAMHPEKQFELIAKGIGSIQNPAERATAAVLLFGREGRRILSSLTDKSALDEAQRSLGQLPEVLARNVPVLDSISDAIGRLPNKVTQFWAGALDVIGATVDSIITKIDGIDLTRAGQSFGNFVKLTVQYWDAGRIDELIGLTIEAGTEIGLVAMQSFVRGTLNLLTTQNVANAIGNGIVTMLATVGKAVIDLQAMMKAPFLGLAVWVGDQFRFAFEKVGQVFEQSLVGVMVNFASQAQMAVNGLIAAANQLGINISPVSLAVKVKAPGAVRPAMSLDEAQGSGQLVSQAMAEREKLVIDVILEKYRNLFDINKDITDQNGKQVTALEKLKALVAGVGEDLEPKGAKAGASPLFANGGGFPVIDEARKTHEFLDDELRIRRELLDVVQQSESFQADYSKGAVEKWYERQTALNAEISKNKELLGKYEARREQLKHLNDDNGVKEMNAKIDETKRAIAGEEVQKKSAGPAPDSFSGSMIKAMVEIHDQWTSMAHQMATAFKNVMGAAVSSISGGIQGLIKGTLTWGQALRTIGTGIVDSIIKAFSDMVAQWIVSHVVMEGVAYAYHAVISALGWAEVTESNAQAAAKTPALAGNAILASIGSWGVAVVVGLAAIAGILAATGTFAEGGYTGPGDKWDPAGIVHRGEYVLTKHQVETIGLANVHAFATGAAVAMPTASPVALPAPSAKGSYATGGLAGSPGKNFIGSPAVHVHTAVGVFTGEADATEWAKSQKGRAIIVEAATGAATQIVGKPS